MKKLLILALGLLVISCSSQNSKMVTMKGSIANVKDGTSIYISQLVNGSQTVVLDTAKVKNGKFMAELPKVDFQSLNVLRVENIPGNMLFINENEPLMATVYKDSIRSSKIEGGPSNAVFSDYMDRLNTNNNKLMAMRQNFSREDLKKRSIKRELFVERQQVLRDNAKYQVDAIQNHPNSLATVFIFRDMLRTHLVPFPKMKKLYDGLSPEIKKTHIGQQIDAQLSQAEATEIGGKAPGFSAKTPQGKELALSDVVQNGKYTLVDFWASWCGPCRRENPNVVRAYHKYHSKGLNILGVSLDRKKTKWVSAIKADRLVWPQVSNLMFWQDPIAQKYNVRSIPTNFLLDSNGRIVAKNLRGANLENKLADLLGK